MVRVITIRDEVYDKLKKLKRKKHMSFSQIIDLLITEFQKTKGGKLEMLLLAGSLKASKIKMRNIKRLRKRL